jgi:hypothetical protein
MLIRAIALQFFPEFAQTLAEAFVFSGKAFDLQPC